MKEVTYLLFRDNIICCHPGYPNASIIITPKVTAPLQCYGIGVCSIRVNYCSIRNLDEVNQRTSVVRQIHLSEHFKNSGV